MNLPNALTITRIFDFLLWTNIAVVVSTAIFGFGLAGIFLLLWHLSQVNFSMYRFGRHSSGGPLCGLPHD